jgi:leucyl aminopeptidase
MQTILERKDAAAVPADALIIVVFEGEAEERFGAKQWRESGEIAGKPHELTLVHGAPGAAAARVLFAGAGKREKAGVRDLRNLMGEAVRFLKGKSMKRVAAVIEGSLDNPEFIAAAVEGAILGDWEPDVHKGGEKKALESFAVVAAGKGAEASLERGRVLAEAQNAARALGNEPANLMTPLKLAEAAKKMAAEFGLEYEALDREAMAKLGMGSLLGVAQGSAEPPVLIVIRYKPANAAGGDHLALVGKGVTFDTGGISIKPADGMEKMKYDMCGGAAMIGAMQALAQLKPKIPVTAFIPCVENMPGSKAQRPGDIVTAMNGKTIEVLNTDAEGRLILADAMSYARKQGCTHMVDAATLTGAIVVALGHMHVGLFSNDDGLRDRVLEASKAEGERMWPMPLDEDYKDYMKSPFADIGNIGGRWGGAVTAAIFLKEFAEETPWVHLDIAGTAWLDDNKPHMPKGPTGVAVRTMARLAMDWK